MSGGITQLVAIGAQDAHIVGDPQVSFFRSTYRRHTNFAQVTDRQLFQGNITNGGLSTIQIERKGDLVSYMYLVPHDGTQAESIDDWSTVIEKIELLIGGQVIDEQTAEFSQRIAHDLYATSQSKSQLAGHYKSDTTNSQFYPLRFFFCENWESALPLVALQYHDVELRITWGAQATNHRWECFANFIYLDTDERTHFAGSPEIQMLITQTQKSTGSHSKIQELNFNHPVKFLASSNVAGGENALCSVKNKVKLQINGTDVADFKYSSPHFTAVTSFYHTTHCSNVDGDTRFIMPFCLQTSKHQPSGTLNFSRLDSARLVSETDNFTKTVYAVNYNILKISNGMGGLLYSN